MPNWCENEVTISGDKKEVKKFIKFVKSKKSAFDFNKIYPMPKELEGTVSGSEELKSDEQKANSKKWLIQFGADNWYDWKNMHWGTKWELNTDEIDFEYDEDYISYHFNTAWCPPEGILKKLHDVFKFNNEENSLHIQWFYREDGMGFCGYLDQELGINNQF
tara:strand:+ start:124 stop:609 length:486 start_codon:yes stop_codon:yes gene_type:complete